MLAGLGVRYALFHLWEGGLGDRKIARRRDRDEAVVTLVYVQLAIDRDVVHARIGAGVGHHHQPRLYQHPHAIGHVRSLKTVTATRSEEHTSELQSLMRISYDVFCLQKKKLKNKKH